MNSEEYKEDILFNIDMEIYDKFNKKMCEMNEHLGDIYSYKDIEDLEKYKKEEEIKLLRKAIAKQAKEIEELKIILSAQINQNEQLRFENKRYVNELCYVIPSQKDDYILKQKIKDKIEKIKKMPRAYDEYWNAQLEVLEELLEERS